MRIVLAGGGSGGHVTPLKAVYDALKKQDSTIIVTVITDHGFLERTHQIFADDEVEIQAVLSGKYRRYHGKSFLWHLTHLPTLLLNIRDAFLLGLGTLQSVVRFLLIKPDIIFCKGGFVCVPIGLAARLFRVPIIIHDSDTRPGITNRILSRWATSIATGMPASFYPYQAEKMHYTGIPVDTLFQPVAAADQADFKTSLGLPSERPLLLITGGGNGALSLNQQLSAAAQQLLVEGWSIILLAGTGKHRGAEKVRSQLPQELQEFWQIEEFAAMLPRLLAADVVVARTSASTLQECANAKKAVIGIPSPHLEDQQQNAAFFSDEKSIYALDETQLSSDGIDLIKAVGECKNEAPQLQRTLHKKFAKPKAADEIAALIIKSDR